MDEIKKNQAIEIIANQLTKLPAEIREKEAHNMSLYVVKTACKANFGSLPENWSDETKKLYELVKEISSKAIAKIG
jgi:hypothetical protein